MLLAVGVVASSCDNPSTPAQVAGEPVNTAPTIRKELWPPDTTIRSSDTLIHVPTAYRLHWLTKSLNDNAVFDTVQDDHGKLLIAAHNYQTELQAWQGKKLLFTTTLTKQLMGAPEVVKAYSWHDIQYQGYRNGEFVFRAWMNVPDSDIGQNAEIAVNKTGVCRLRARPTEIVAE